VRTRYSVPATVLAGFLALTGDGVAQDRSIFSVLDTQGRSVAMAARADGTLSDQDVLSAGGRRVQVWALSATPGSAIQVDLRSADFDAFLYLVGPGLGEGLRDDDGGDGLNSRLCVEVSEPGEYRVVASSLGGGTGAFTLEVTEAPGAGDGSCPAAATGVTINDLSLLPTEGRVLGPGEDVQGFLGPDDPTVFESPAQAWSVEGRAGESFSVDLVSDDFDAYLMVEGPGLESWLQDDDGAGRCDSRLTFDFPQTGAYRVVASTLDATGGAFRLVTSREPGPPDPASCIASNVTDDAPPADPGNVIEVGALQLGEPVTGIMTGSEGTYSGRSMQGWTLDAMEGDRIAIEMRSADFDSYLYFSGPGFADPLYDDDGAGNLHSRICVEIPETGRYSVFAGPFSGPNAGNRFTLRASADAGSACDYFELAPERIADHLRALATDGRVLTVGDEGEGFLDQNSARHPESGRRIQPWSLTLDAGERVWVEVIADDFDAVLYAIGPGLDEALFADDAEGCLHSRMEIVAPGSGTMTLLPGAFTSDVSGPYRIRVLTEPGVIECAASGGGGGATTGMTTATTDASTLGGVSTGADRPLAMGTEVAGVLGITSETLSGGQPIETWTVDVEAGDEIVFELLSDDFDPLLYLDGPGLDEPLMDDDGAGSLDSRIVFIATESGTMRLVASGLTESAAGAYRLRAIRRAR